LGIFFFADSTPLTSSVLSRDDDELALGALKDSEYDDCPILSFDLTGGDSCKEVESAPSYATVSSADSRLTDLD
jgi:hypothetical protein